MTEDDWKAKLTPQQYKILREKGTDPPFGGKYVFKEDDGVYNCAGCGAAIFSSDTQYESTIPGLIGWPSFADVIDSRSVKVIDDETLGMSRTEVVCANCGGHLGHLFPDHTSVTGEHYCINGTSLDFKKS